MIFSVVFLMINVIEIKKYQNLCENEVGKAIIAFCI
jgi:hypothetical protein